LNIPLAVRGVCFAKQSPQSGVQPHSDGRNFILTSHLGIQVPTSTISNTTDSKDSNLDDDDQENCCWIQVGQERRTWQRGKLLTIDTSFVHSTGNDSPDQERHVLIIDFWHPELSEVERDALTFIYDLRNKFETGQIPLRKPNQRRWQQQQLQQRQQQLPNRPDDLVRGKTGTDENR
jgi:aspartyl/asparaginyl beta-hydroxylase (cupin superfamily)